jgi:hypothetical protein
MRILLVLGILLLLLLFCVQVLRIRLAEPGHGIALLLLFRFLPLGPRRTCVGIVNLDALGFRQLHDVPVIKRCLQFVDDLLAIIAIGRR